MNLVFQSKYNIKLFPIFFSFVFASAVLMVPAASFADITVGAPYLYGPMAYYSRTDCPANSFMDGLKRHQQKGDTENTQIVCQNYDPAKIIATGSAYTFGDMNRSHQDNCPAGSFMAGINRRPSDDLDKTQIVCQNYDTGRSAINTSGAPYLYGPMTYYDIETDCPAGSFMAGINRTHDGDWEKWQVVCQNYVLSTSTIQGLKVKMPGNDSGAVPPGQETVSLDNGNQTTANPYFFRDVSAGNHTVSVSVPTGWSAGYTLCYNSTGCHGSAPTPGNSVSVNVPAGGYADLWWHYSLSTGTVKIKATKDGQPWDSPPLVVDVTTPVGRMNVTADPPDELRDVPAGWYAVHNITAPPSAGVTLVDFSPGTAMQNLPAGGIITFTFNFKTNPPAAGIVKIKATKDGSPWDSLPFKVNSSIPGSVGDIEIDPAIPSQDIADAPAGTYTANNIPPNQQALAGVTFQDVNGSSLPYGQNLTAGGTITFTFNFTTAAQPVPTLVVSPASASIGVGNTQQFNAIYDPDGSGAQSPQTVTSSASWSSSNSFIASISGVLAAGHAAGSVIITAQYAGLTATAALTVAGAPPPSPPPPSPPSVSPTVSLSANPTSVTSGQSSQLSWTSTNAASCSASGGWSGLKSLSGTQSTGALSVTTAFTLSCSGAEGSTVASATVSVEQIPPEPPDLSVYAPSLNSCGAIRLVWNNVAGEDRYEIERDSGSGFAKIGESGRDGTSFTDTMIAQNASYSYRVRACNAFGCSAYSNTAAATNRSPAANFSFFPATPAVNQTTVFTDISAYFGSPASRQWTFEDGIPASATVAQATTSAKFADIIPAQKQVTLRAADTAGRTCSVTKTIPVQSGASSPPWIEIPPE